MHLLTKLFIVLVSLLAVFLVPLVVVYAHNENSYKAKYQVADAQRAAAVAAKSSTELLASKQSSAQQLVIEQYRTENNSLIQDRDQKAASIRKLESDLADSKSLQGQINTKLATLASSVDSGQQLIGSLIGELRALRTDALASERRTNELQERLNDVAAQLEVAVAARRSLQEEVQRLREDHGRAMDTIARMTEKYGAPPAAGVVGPGEIAPDRSLTAHVLEVKRDKDQILADIDVGSVDGVKVGWMMILARGDQFLGKLHIIEVDVKRATGKVLKEDTKVGKVSEGDLAIANVGRR